MTHRRIFLINEDAAVNIILSRYHNRDRALDKLLLDNGVEMRDDETFDAAIRRLSDKQIEYILDDSQY
jgi:hypothetical protein